MVQVFARACRPGAYLRIVTEGELGAGDAIEVLDRPGHGVTIELVSRAVLLDKSLRERAVSAPQLAAGLAQAPAPGSGGVARGLGDCEPVGPVVERLVGVPVARLVPAHPVPAHGGVAADLRLQRRSRSWFLTGLPAAVFQPLRFQPGSHVVIEFSISCESVTMHALAASGSERRPSSAAVSSMRLFVVSGSPPESSTGSPPSGGMTIAAQPPGPGLPLQAPSVHTSASPGRCSTGVCLGVRGGAELASAGDGSRGWDSPSHETPTRPREKRLAPAILGTMENDIVIMDGESASRHRLARARRRCS